jgi:hypothetical protein
MSLKGFQFPDRRPTLDFKPALLRRLDPNLVFERSTTATFTGRDGVIRSAGPGAPRFDTDLSTGANLGLRVEAGSTNFVSNSQNLTRRANNLTNTLPPPSFTSYVQPHAALAPDGTFTASRVISGSYSNALNTIITASSSGPYTASCWYRKDPRQIHNGPAGPSAGISLFSNTGNTRVFLSDKTDAVNWTRIHITVNLDPGSHSFNFLNAFNVENVSYLIWGAQIEPGPFPSTYIPTPATFTGRTSTATYYDADGILQTAAVDEARDNAYFPDENGIMRPAELLLETAATNYAKRLQNWNRFGEATTTSNAGIAPDGTNTAVKLERASSGNHWYRLDDLALPPNANMWARSVFLKAGSRDSVTINFLEYNLTTGTVGSGGYMIPLPNGWYRCVRIQGSSTDFVIAMAGAGYVYAWGAQQEAGDYASSYIDIPGTSTVTRSADTSTSSTVTRSAEILTLSGSRLDNAYNPAAGTLYTQVSVPASTTPLPALELQSATETDSMALLANNGTGQGAFRITADGTTTVDITDATIPAGAKASTKLAASYSPNQFSLAQDGNIAVTADSGLPLPNITTLGIGYSPSTNTFLNGTVKRVAYWPSVLPDATLRGLTI